MRKVTGSYNDEEIALLGTDTDEAVARRLGRTPKSVRGARRHRGIPPFRSDRLRHEWTKRELALLGRHTDAEVARRIGRSRIHVTRKRLALGIPAFRQDRTRKALRQT